MHTQIRLARAQGLLTGDVSPVQAHALFLLDLIEQIRDAEREDRALRQSLLATGVPFARLFPEYVVEDAAEETEVGEDELEETLAGTGPVHYVAPEGAMSEERMNELLGQLASEHTSGSLSAAELEGWL